VQGFFYTIGGPPPKRVQLKQVGFFLESTCEFAGIQFTKHFIKFVLEEHRKECPWQLGAMGESVGCEEGRFLI
jgi:hypothetical protein